MIRGETIAQNDTMIKSSVKPTVVGTRSGYAIHFTCPSCEKENSIMYNMPKAYYKESRDATCAKCKKQYTILTP
jgi:transcription elongation factor Elf1